jgi:hypothetical protein
MNNAGTAYGNEVHFNTNPIVGAKVATTIDTVFVNDNTADVGGIIIDDGGHLITERGVCWATTTNPTIDNKVISCGKDTGRFSCFLKQLQPGTLYHVRAYAITMAGVAYGADRHFLTHAFPTVETTHVTDLSRTTAVAGGTLRLTGTPMIRGSICFGTKASPTIEPLGGEGRIWFDSLGIEGVFTINLTGLTPGTLYYVRTYVTFYKNMSHPYNFLWFPHLTEYGKEVTFITSP